MAQHETLIEFYRAVPVKKVWTGIFFIVLIFGGIFAGATGRRLIAENGIGGPDDIIQAAAIHCFPLTLGMFLITVLFIALAYAAKEDPEVDRNGTYIFLCFASATILWGAGKLAALLGVGLLPDESAYMVGQGPRMLFGAFRAYLNAYGWPLAVCGTAIGIGGALHAGNWWAKRQPD